MRLLVQTPTRPCQMLFALDDVVGAETRRVRVAVAFATLDGCKLLLDRLSRWEARAKRIAKEFVVSLDYGITDPKALDYLRNPQVGGLRVANVSAIHRPLLRPAQAFHPKLYIVDDAAKSVVFAGSGNLTVAGMTTNSEVFAVEEFPSQTQQLEKGWESLVANSEVITDRILDAYQKARKRLARDLKGVDSTLLHSPEVASPEFGRERALRHPVFFNEVDSGQFIPSAFDCFWMEAGAMPSSASHNQLELPRGVNHFFGYHFNDYQLPHCDIGPVTISKGRQRWENRKLVWHGDNRMERIYLPTARQGGFAYPNTIILFRRRLGSFEIFVEQPTSPLVAHWYATSNAIHTIFRLSESRSDRICGLF